MRWTPGAGDRKDVIDARGDSSGGGRLGGMPGGVKITNTQNTWASAFQHAGRPYQRAKLYLYRGGVRTACGSATSAAGPFYCPGDQRVYLDLSFYPDMEQQLGAKGDFAWAYVIAHELGQKVQQDLQPADAEEALGAASAVGDDRLQRAATGTINPDTFTHGTSAPRVAWFKRGRQSGEPARCDTFSPASL